MCIRFLHNNVLSSGVVFQCCKRNVKRQLDHNIEFHKLCAYGIVFFTGTDPLLLNVLLCLPTYLCTLFIDLRSD